MNKIIKYLILTFLFTIIGCTFLKVNKKLYVCSTTEFQKSDDKLFYGKKIVKLNNGADIYIDTMQNKYYFYLPNWAMM